MFSVPIFETSILIFSDIMYGDKEFRIMVGHPFFAGLAEALHPHLPVGVVHSSLTLLRTLLSEQFGQLDDHLALQEGEGVGQTG
jgi:hypothetical protein